MPECTNCGNHITTEYFRVFAIEGVVACCPRCEDRTRGPDGRPRDSDCAWDEERRAAQGHSTFDEEVANP